MNSNIILIDRDLLKREIANSGKKYSDLAVEYGFGRGIINNAVTRGRISKLNLRVLSEALGKDPEYFILKEKEEQAKEEVKEEPSSEDFKLLYRAVSDLNRHLFDISVQLKELNGKSEACRVGLVNESVHLYDIKQLLISLNKELMGESK